MARFRLLVLGLAACSQHASQQPRPPPAAPAAGSGSGSPANDRLLSLLRFAKPGTPDYDATIAKLQELRGSATPAEQPLFDQMISTMREFKAIETDSAHARDHTVTAMRTLIDVVRAMADLEKHDVATERALISSLSMIPYQLENLELTDQFDLSALRQEALARSRALVHAFPNDARSWKLLGWMETAFGTDPAGSLAAMRAYQTCATLDPALDACAQELAHLRTEFVAPYCDGPNIRTDFAWYEGSDAGTEGGPRFTSKDLARLRATISHVEGGPITDAETGRVIEYTRSMDAPVVVLDLRPEIVKPMTQWLQEVQKRGHFMTLKLGARVLFDTRNSYFSDHDIPGWQVPNLKLEDLCAKIQRQTLPPDLAAVRSP